MNVDNQEDCQMARKLAHNSKIPIQVTNIGNQGASKKPNYFSEKKVQYLHCKFEASRRNWNHSILRQKCSNQN